jgi:hypothetical protein
MQISEVSISKKWKFRPESLKIKNSPLFSNGEKEGEFRRFLQ